MQTTVPIFTVVVAIFSLCCMELSSAMRFAADDGGCARSQEAAFAALKAKVDTLEKLFDNAFKSIPGRDGRDGAQGISGVPGKNGQKGLNGDKGSQGPAGPRGSTGKQGLAGVGVRGVKGDVGSKGQKGEMANSDSVLDALSVTYTRWGRTSCSAGAELVYKGRVGGEHYRHTGGGTNYECLPDNPIYDKYSTENGGVAFMYNAQYKFHSFKPFGPNVRDDDDVPCGVCRVKRKSSLLVIPARNVCPSGWRREYYGYLMTEHYNHAHPKDFVCVDRNAEAVPETRADKSGAFLYFVDGKCGGHLPCGPYKDNAELTCAVCSI